MSAYVNTRVYIVYVKVYESIGMRSSRKCLCGIG